MLVSGILFHPILYFLITRILIIHNKQCNKIGSEGADRIGEAMKFNQTLTYLNLKVELHIVF